MEVEIGLGQNNIVIYLVILGRFRFCFEQFTYHDVVTKVERQVPVSSLPHLCYKSLEKWHSYLTINNQLIFMQLRTCHLGGYIDVSFVE